MFLLNSCLGQFSAASFEAPFLPKLQGHFAEFLDNTSSAGLRILSSSTCVGLRYGYGANDSSFSRHSLRPLSYLKFGRLTEWRSACLLSHARLPAFSAYSIRGQSLEMRPCSSVASQYRNLHLSSIGYGFRPRLRSRLTQGRSALPWKP